MTQLESVNIRMYRQGFGDCFLLTFKYSNSTLKRIMIDFGVLMGSNGESKMEAVAQNILDETQVDGKSKIDILVVTHEHWDHFSGFTAGQAKDIIKHLQVEKIWLAWTEDPEDENAIQLKERKEKLKKNIEKGVGELARTFTNSFKATDEHKDAHLRAKKNLENDLSNILEILKFDSTSLIDINPPTLDEGDNNLNLGFLNSLTNLGEESFGVKQKKNPKVKREGLVDILADVWPEIKEKQDELIKFHEAGKLIELPWAGLRIYSLGPPNDWDYIRRNETSSSGGLYLNEKIFENPSESNIKNPNTFVNSFLFADKDRQEKWSDADIPFDENWVSYKYSADKNKIELKPLTNQTLKEQEQKRVYDAVRNSIVFKTYTGNANLGNSKDENDEYDEFNTIRRIDFDYLSYIEPLAMKLNSHTNNTSLVLAIELIDSGKVLLFPGDAQYGNWLSWTDKKLKWEILNKNNVKQTITVEDLLARTVFYKVSHHGSHNGTPKDKGLALMNNGNLIAAIPVDADAAQQKKWNQIPYNNILDELKVKTKKINNSTPAILRSDRDFATQGEINGDNKLYFDIKIENK